MVCAAARVLVICGFRTAISSCAVLIKSEPKPDCCFYAFSLREPESTSLENAMINKMTAHGGRTLLVAIDLLAFLVALLRLHRERRDRARLQPLQRDRLAGLLAIAVAVVLDALQRRVDLGDQLALAVAGAQFDRAVGLRRRAVGEIGMIDVLFLQGLQRDPRFPEDLVLPRQQLGAKIIALAVVHERLFFGGSIISQLFQVQPVCDARRPKSLGPRAPYIAVSRDRQYRLQPGSCGRQKFPPAEPVRDWGAPGYYGQNRRAIELPALELPGLGEFDFDPQLDLGQDRVKAGVAGRGFEVGGGIPQPAHRGSVEIAGQQADLEGVQHVERTLAALH